MQNNAQVDTTLLNKYYFEKVISEGDSLKTQLEAFDELIIQQDTASARDRQKLTQRRNQMLTFLDKISIKFENCRDITETFVRQMNVLLVVLCEILAAFGKLGTAYSPGERIKLIEKASEDIWNRMGVIEEQFEKMKTEFEQAEEGPITTREDVLALIRESEELKNELESKLSKVDSLQDETTKIAGEVRRIITEIKNRPFTKSQAVKDLELKLSSCSGSLSENKENYMQKSQELAEKLEIFMNSMDTYKNANAGEQRDQYRSLCESLADLKKNNLDEWENCFIAVTEELREIYSMVEKMFKEASKERFFRIKENKQCPLTDGQNVFCLVQEEVYNNLRIECQTADHHRDSLCNTDKLMCQNIVSIKNNALQNAVIWPIVVCIPQKEEISDHEIGLVEVKWTDNPAAVEWESMKPSGVNKQFVHESFNLEGKFYTTVKIDSSRTLAVVVPKMIPANPAVKQKTSGPQQPSLFDYRSRKSMEAPRPQEPSLVDYLRIALKTSGPQQPSLFDYRSRKSMEAHRPRHPSLVDYMGRIALKLSGAWQPSPIDSRAPNAALSDDFLYVFADKLSHDTDWRRIFRRLKVEGEICEIQLDSKHEHARETIYRCLLKWKHSSSDSEQQLEDLIRVLEEFKRFDLVDWVCIWMYTHGT